MNVAERGVIAARLNKSKYHRCPSTVGLCQLAPATAAFRCRHTPPTNPSTKPSPPAPRWTSCRPTRTTVARRSSTESCSRWRAVVIRCRSSFWPPPPRGPPRRRSCRRRRRRGARWRPLRSCGHPACTVPPPLDGETAVYCGLVDRYRPRQRPLGWTTTLDTATSRRLFLT